jgi:hypothetical protein
MNILERFKRNSPIHWKLVGTALVAASIGTIQYFAADNTALRVLGALMFIGYLLTHLTVENNNDKSAQ